MIAHTLHLLATGKRVFVEENLEVKKRFIVDLISEMSIELMEYFINSVTVRHAGGNSTLSKLFYVAVSTSHNSRRKSISRTGKYMAGVLSRLGLIQFNKIGQ